MKVIVLAAGQGTRLRPLTDHRPKCMVEINGRSIIERQLATMNACGVRDEDIYIVTGYKGEVLKEYFKDRKLNFIENTEYETTNMVCSLMCAKAVMEQEQDIIVSYGDIVYSDCVFRQILKAEDRISVVVDDGWFSYWKKRCDNPLDDAETLIFDMDDFLLEIGQKTDDITKVQSQYIGLMHYRNGGVEKMLELCNAAKVRSSVGEALWRTSRNYSKMYMTDMLQGLIDEGNQLRAVHINRGWYEVDCAEDLAVAEEEMAER